MINIAEKLKDVPIGTKLYSPLFGDVKLTNVRDDYIGCFNNRFGNQEFNPDGTFALSEECLLFPSKENRDWESFAIEENFKKGDFVKTFRGGYGIFTGEMGELFLHLFCCYHPNSGFFEDKVCTTKREGCVLASGSEKEKLLEVIEKNGYIWDDEKLEFRRNPKFNVGDKIISINGGIVFTVESVSVNGYDCIGSNGHTMFFGYTAENDYTLYEEPKLKPFDGVLVRDNEEETWNANFFSHYEPDYNKVRTLGRFVTVNNSNWKECLPYEGNEHLVGTSACAS